MPNLLGVEDEGGVGRKEAFTEHLLHTSTGSLKYRDYFIVPTSQMRKLRQGESMTCMSSGIN